jgi:hypothetical protein
VPPPVFVPPPTFTPSSSSSATAAAKSTQQNTGGGHQTDASSSTSLQQPPLAPGEVILVWSDEEYSMVCYDVIFLFDSLLYQPNISCQSVYFIQYCHIIVIYNLFRILYMYVNIQQEERRAQLPRYSGKQAHSSSSVSNSQQLSSSGSAMTTAGAGGPSLNISVTNVALDHEQLSRFSQYLS